MILTEEHQIKPTHRFWSECDELCFKSKNLYNSSLYTIRQWYLETKSYKHDTHWIFSYGTLYHLLKQSPDFRTDFHEFPKKTNTKCMKQVYHQINEIFSSFFKAQKSYSSNPSKFTGKPKLPNYKHKTDGRNVFVFPKDAISFKKPGYIHLSMTDIFIKTDITKQQIKEVQIVPTNTNYYKILISYKTEKLNTKEEIKYDITKAQPTDRFVGADLGVNNLITLTSNDIGFNPIIINGRPIKSINQYYNKKLAKLKSGLHPDTRTSSLIKILTRKRNNKLKSEIHKITTCIADMLAAQEVKCLVIGNNKNWKQNIKLGKKINQNFVGIPFTVIINQLKYKCELRGIAVILNEESYTSKCSFLDNEVVGKHEIYLGSRIHRGLFKSGSGQLINADVNGSLNILKKVAGDRVFSYPVEAYAVTPALIHLRTH